MSDNLINDEVMSTVERIESADSIDNIDPLDVEYTVGIGGDIREITLILTVGGPYIELNVTKGYVYGSWGDDTHTAPIFENEQLVDRLHEYYSECHNLY